MHIADLFYMIIHDERGAPRLHEAATAYGLAAALLAELVHTGRIAIDPNERVRIVSRDPPVDVVGHEVLDTLASEPKEHPLRSWIRFFGRTAVISVADRIARTGLLEVQGVRGFMGLGTRKTIYVPVRPDDFEAQFAVLRMALLQRKITEPTWLWCAALAHATGLSPQLLIDAPADSYKLLDWIIARELPVSCQPLVNATSVCISEAVFAHH